jgi:hypothetical protein
VLEEWVHGRNGQLPVKGEERMTCRCARFEHRRPAAAAPVGSTAIPAEQVTDDVERPLRARAGAGGFAVVARCILVWSSAACLPGRYGHRVWGLNKPSGGHSTSPTSSSGSASATPDVHLRHPAPPPTNGGARRSIASAEAMTIFRVMCAAMFPLIPMGGPWLAFFFVARIPTRAGPLWVNFRSPLLWDVFAINTYLTISLVFWYLGMIPDFATLRTARRSGISSGSTARSASAWNGSYRTGRATESEPAARGLATALVILGALDRQHGLRVSILPGWHTTIFPPYFVAGRGATPASAWC